MVRGVECGTESNYREEVRVSNTVCKGATENIAWFHRIIRQKGKEYTRQSVFAAEGNRMWNG